MSFGSGQNWHNNDNMRDTDSPEVADHDAHGSDSGDDGSGEIVDLAHSDSPEEQPYLDQNPQQSQVPQYAPSLQYPPYAENLPQQIAQPPTQSHQLSQSYAETANDATNYFMTVERAAFDDASEFPEAVEALRTLETYRGPESQNQADTDSGEDNSDPSDDEECGQRDEATTGDDNTEEESQDDTDAEMDDGSPRLKGSLPDKVEFPESAATSRAPSAEVRSPDTPAESDPQSVGGSAEEASEIDGADANAGRSYSDSDAEESDGNSEAEATQHTPRRRRKLSSRKQDAPGIDPTALMTQIRNLEAAQWDLERQLHQAQLQYDSARQEQLRQAVLAEKETEQLRQLRTSSAREKAALEAQIVELKAAADSSRTDQESRDRSFALLRERFSAQSATLSDLRQQMSDMERTRLQNEAEVRVTKQAETRYQRQLQQLRDELSVALEDAAQARAELDIHIQSMAEMRAQAREEALVALAEDLPDQSLGDLSNGSLRLNTRLSEARDDQMWRKQYIALRKEMDDVAAEFEQREPQIMALQLAYDDAEARLAASQSQLAAQQQEKEGLEQKIRQAERRSADLAVYQQLSETQLNDLRRQVLVLLTEKALSSTGGQPLSPEEEDELVRLRQEISRSNAEAHDMSETTNGETMITERLLLFKDVAELQLQNEALLKACRELASQLDPDVKARNGAFQTLESQKAEDLARATEVLESLEAKFTEVKAELESVRSVNETAQKELTIKETANAHLKERVAELETKLKEARLKFSDHSSDNSVLSEYNRKYGQPLDETLLKSKLKAAEDRVSDLRLEASQYRDESKLLSQELARVQLAVGKAEQRQVDSQQTVAELRAQIENQQHQMVNLQKENQLIAQREQQLIIQLAHARMEITGAKRDAEAARQEAEVARRKLSEVSSRRGDVIGENAQVNSDLSESPSVDKLQVKLQEQINKLEALVASQSSSISATTSPTPVPEVSVESLSSISLKLEGALARSEELQKKIDQLELELQQRTSEKANLSAAETELRQSRSELESQLNELNENNAQLKAQVSALTSDLTEKDARMHDQSEKSHSREQELIEQVNNLEDQLIEAQNKAEKASIDNSALTLKLDQQAKNLIAAEQKLDEPQAPSDADVEKLKAELAAQLREAIESEIKQQYENQLRSKNLEESHSSVDVDISDIAADDLNGLKSRIQTLLPANVLNRFEQSVLQAEQNRTKEIFKQKLDETRSIAQKAGEENASRRAEMRTKLQTQKMQRIESRNQELEKQVEELRNKVRRLKGGEAVDDPNDKSREPQKQDSQMTSQPNSSGKSSPSNSSIITPFIPTGNSFSPSLFHQQPRSQDSDQQELQQGAPAQQFALPFMASAFEPSKRLNFFEESEAKKRKEE